MALRVFRSSVPTWTAASKNAVPPLKSPALHRRSPSRANSRQEASILNTGFHKQTDEPNGDKAALQPVSKRLGWDSSASQFLSRAWRIFLLFFFFLNTYSSIFTERCQFNLSRYLNGIKMLFMGILQHLEGGNVSVYWAWVKLIKSIVSVAQ